MATVQAEPRNGAAEVLQDVQADLSQMGQLYERVSQRLLERLKAVDKHVEALTKERDALRKEVEQLRQTLAESHQDIKLYQRSLLAVTHKPFTFTKEELDEMRRNPTSFEDMVAEILQEEEK